MKTPVIAIGLDAADPSTIEAWIDQGHLKNLKRLRDEGAYGRLRTLEYYRAETPWMTFLTGVPPEQTGYWAQIKLEEGTYTVRQKVKYDYGEYLPFYALGDDFKVAVIDMPKTVLTEKANGPQVLAWGAHSPNTPSHSLPKPLFQELVDKHGEHPVLRKDQANVFDLQAINKLKEALQVGIQRRTAICCDILHREPWNLFLAIFGEPHTAGHYFWHLSQPDHPLYPLMASQCQEDPMLAVFKTIDQAIGEIVSQAPDDARVVVFSAHGMGANVMDLPSMLFLPEFLYRWNFPGKAAIAPGKLGAKLPPVMTGRLVETESWARIVWNLTREGHPIKDFLKGKLPQRLYHRLEKMLGEPDEPHMTSPFKLWEQKISQPFQPVSWYRQFWPQMKAFAIPSFSEGYIRINLQGREPNGIVAPEDYATVCEEIINKLRQLKDARTGVAMVKDIIRTRENPLANDPKLPDADIVVIWQEESVADVVESPEVGRIGPVPIHRTGSHRASGFMVAKGPGVDAGSSLDDGHGLDIAPTLLNLMGAPVPDYMPGKIMVKTPISVG